MRNELTKEGEIPNQRIFPESVKYSLVYIHNDK